MARRLIVLTRMLLIVVALTSLLALAVAGIESPATPSVPVLSGRWESIHDESSTRRSQGEGTLYLIDRESGRSEAISFPGNGRWSALSVSPWSETAGSVEAVGLCLSLPTRGGARGFVGLARLRLPEARLINLVPIDVLPTSRPRQASD